MELALWINSQKGFIVMTKLSKTSVPSKCPYCDRSSINSTESLTRNRLDCDTCCDKEKKAFNKEIALIEEKLDKLQTLQDNFFKTLSKR